MKAKKKKEDLRINNLDLLKFLAIISVIIYHGTLFDYNIVSSHTANTYFSYFFMGLISMCIPIFFLVNGYLLFSKEFDLNKHKKQIIKYFVILVISSIFLYLFYSVLNNKSTSFLSFFNAILNTKKIYYMHILWFLGVLISIYLLFPILKFIYDKNIKLFIYLTILFFLISFIFNSLHFNLIYLLSPIKSDYNWTITYFCFGGLLFKYKNKFKSINKLKLIIIIFISNFLIFYEGITNSLYQEKSTWDIVWNNYDSIFTFVNVLCIYNLSLCYNKSYKFIRFISENTLGVYLIHPIFITLSINSILSIKYFCNIPFNIVYLIIIATICSIIWYFLKYLINSIKNLSTIKN